MSINLGDFLEDSIINLFFTTNSTTGGIIAPSSAFEAADVNVYKNNSNSEKTTDNGVTMTSPFDSTVGLHQINIDTSDDTGDAGFWDVGNDYTIVLSPDETVDGQTVVQVLGVFSIENRSMSTASGEPGQGIPPASATMAEKIDYLYKNWRNKKRQNSTLFELYDDAGTTVDQKATISEASGLFTKTEMESGA